MPQEIGAWLHIGEDGQITVYTGKVEVGQNIRTSLTQVVAEELRAPLGSIQLVMADTQLTPFDMGTFGSRTTPDDVAAAAAHGRGRPRDARSTSRPRPGRPTDRSSPPPTGPIVNARTNETSSASAS